MVIYRPRELAAVPDLIVLMAPEQGVWSLADAVDASIGMSCPGGPEKRA